MRLTRYKVVLRTLPSCTGYRAHSIPLALGERLSELSSRALGSIDMTTLRLSSFRHLGACLVTIAGTSFPAHGYTGNDIHSSCSDDSTAYSAGFCTGYIAGVIEMTAVVALLNDQLCIPAGVTVGQGEDIVTKYAEEHPEKRHLSAPGLILSALLAAFPCN